MATEMATFGMGCFWGPEHYFSKVDGVVKTEVGYAGGTKEHPSYFDLGDNTEVVQVTFDPAVISYEEMLEHFWMQQNPTVKQKTQYQSLILTHSEKQLAAAKKSLEEEKKRISGEIVTMIMPIGNYTKAEEFHQQYIAKRRGDVACGIL